MRQWTKIVLACFLAFAPAHALAASATLYNPAPYPIYDTTGALARSAKAYFYAAGTGTPITVYQDGALTTPRTYPVEAGLNGVLPAIYLPYVDYRVRITTSAGSVIFDQDNIENQPPQAASAIAASSLIKTGDIISRLSGGTLDGFVRMNGRTIGSASSSATERANADCEDLFTYLWNNLGDSIATVSGGRGSTAAVDWAANKTIVVPTMQGRLLAGVDDMGATAANVLQVSTTTSATNGSPTLTVASATGLARTMYAIIDGVATGQITAISGTTITLSSNYAGVTGGGKAVRFSFFPDAQSVAGVGGSQSAIMTTAEMATHDHGVTDPTHDHDAPFGTSFGVAAGGTSAGVTPASATTASATGITINNNGSGLPSSIVQPARLATFYIKL
jgi:hypothetical protein